MYVRAKIVQFLQFRTPISLSIIALSARNGLQFGLQFVQFEAKSCNLEFQVLGKLQ